MIRHHTQTNRVSRSGWLLVMLVGLWAVTSGQARCCIGAEGGEQVASTAAVEGSHGHGSEHGLDDGADSDHGDGHHGGAQKGCHGEQGAGGGTCQPNCYGGQCPPDHPRCGEREHVLGTPLGNWSMDLEQALAFPGPRDPKLELTDGKSTWLFRIVPEARVSGPPAFVWYCVYRC